MNHLGERQYILAAAKGSGLAYNKAAEQASCSALIQTRILSTMYKMKTQDKSSKNQGCLP